MGYVQRVGTAEPWTDLLVYSWFTHCCYLHLMSVHRSSVKPFWLLWGTVAESSSPKRGRFVQAQGRCSTHGSLVPSSWISWGGWGGHTANNVVWASSVTDPTKPLISNALTAPVLEKSRYKEQRKKSLNITRLLLAFKARQRLNGSGEDPDVLTSHLNRVNSWEVVSETSCGSSNCALLWLSLGFNILRVSVAFEYPPLKRLMLLLCLLNTNLLKCAWLA